jgi:hypothetical protein
MEEVSEGIETLPKEIFGEGSAQLKGGSATVVGDD